MGIKPFTGPKTSCSHQKKINLILKEKDHPHSVIKAIIRLNSAPNMSAKTEATPARTTQLL